MSFWNDSPSSKCKAQRWCQVSLSPKIILGARLQGWVHHCHGVLPKIGSSVRAHPLDEFRPQTPKNTTVVIWQLQGELLTCRFLKIYVSNKKCYVTSCLRLKINVVALISPYLYDVSTKMIRKAKPKLQLQQASVDLCSWIHPFQKTCGFAGACQH